MFCLWEKLNSSIPTVTNNSSHMGPWWMFSLLLGRKIIMDSKRKGGSYTKPCECLFPKPWGKGEANTVGPRERMGKLWRPWAWLPIIGVTQGNYSKVWKSNVFLDQVEALTMMFINSSRGFISWSSFICSCAFGTTRFKFSSNKISKRSLWIGFCAKT